MAPTSKLIAKIESEEPTQHLAVLIDADNARAAILDGLFVEIARFGEATVKRIYGDFTASTSAQWKKVLHTYAIKPVQQFAYTTGKNATDSTLIIDAMDLLYTRRFQGFCLISSDSDFTGLATRIREEGLLVYGFGEQKTPESFRNACHKFIFTEVLRPLAAPLSSTTVPPRASVSAVPCDPIPPLTPLIGTTLPQDMFRQALEQAGDDTGWVSLALFGSQLTKLRAEFDPRNYGYKKLSDLVRAHVELFQIEERTLPNTTTKVLYLRAKEDQKK